MRKMNYELTVSLKTLKKEGLGPFFRKLLLYFQQMLAAFRFRLARQPASSNVEAVVDFSFHVCGGLIRAGQVRSELLAMAKQVRELTPKTVLEIGTATGGTLFVWCTLAHPQATIISIDLPGGIHGGGYPYWKTFLYKTFVSSRQRLHLLRGSSHDPAMLSNLKTVLPDGSIDFLFIDGDHTYEGVKQDYEMYAPLVRKGGLIAFHDICVHPPELDCHVDEFWKELKKRHPEAREFIENPKQGWGGIGVISV
jgi:predicted O-methyltransferase YrrM